MIERIIQELLVAVDHRVEFSGNGEYFIKADFNSSAVTVFDRIFYQILQALCKAVRVAGKNAVQLSLHSYDVVHRRYKH